MGQRTDLTRGVLSLIGLMLLVVGLPIGLIAVAGSPLPSGLPTGSEFTDSLSRPMTDDVLNAVLAVACWLVWAQFTWSVVQEVAAFRKHTASTSRSLVPGPQHLARNLVLAAAVLFTTFHRPPTTTLENITPVATIQLSAASSDAPAVEEPRIEPTAAYTVRSHDSLWQIAEVHLGDGYRWREVFDLNRGVQQTDGRSLSSPQLIRPGWVLAMPNDAVGLEDIRFPTPAENPAAASSVIVEESTPTTTAPQIVVQAEIADQSLNDAKAENVSTLPAVALLGGALGAAGVIALITRLRHIQLRRRPVGSRLTPAPQRIQDIERSLRIAADASQAERLDVALRALGCCLSVSDVQGTPRIDAVRVGDEGIEILFDSPIDVHAAPFEPRAGGRSWWLPSDVHEIRIGALATEVIATVPALMSVGTIDDATVLVDAESVGVTAITGESPLARAAFDAAVTEMATSVWADFLNVVVVDPNERLGELERVVTSSRIDDVLPEIEAAAKDLASGLSESSHASTLSARLVNGTTEGWVPTVVFCAVDDKVGVKRLVELAGKGERGLAVVLLGSSEAAQRTIEVSGVGVTVSPLGLSLNPIAFTTGHVEAIDDLIADAVAEPSYEAAVVEQPTAVDLRDAIVSVEIASREKSTRIELLGEVRAVGSATPFERSRALEVVAYLAMHRRGVTADVLKTAVWPDLNPTNNTFNSTVSNARKCLGREHVPTARDGSPYRIEESVATDVELFSELVNASRVQPSSAVDLLTEALELVRGKPFFSDSKGYEWAYTEGFVASVTAEVADAAHQLGHLALEAGDTQKARWAVAQGLLASPGYEPLYCIRMRAYAADGNDAGVDAVMTELRQVLDAVEPYDSLHPETIATYEELRPTRVGRR